MPTLFTIFSMGLWISAVTLAFVSLVGFLGRRWWIFDIFSHFRVQYAILAALCGVGFLLVKQPIGVALSLGVTLLNLVLLIPFYRRRSPLTPCTSTYRLLSANILGTNGDYTQITQMLETEEPDLALIVEYDQHHEEGLKSVVSKFPYRVLVPREDNYGLALLSQLPFTSSELVLLNDDKIPVLVARLKIAGRHLTIIGSHPPPPKRKWMSITRDRQISALAKLALQQDGEVILLGDFNTTLWSYSFQDLLRLSKLVDSRSGFGVKPTWPAHMPLLKIPIDHILHTPGICIKQLRTGCACGSDHQPLIAEFGMQPVTPTETKGLN